MKGFLEEYGLIIVVVAVILLMLLFGKSGYAKSIQDAILGSADHIVETGENIVPKTVKASDIIEIEGTKYIVLEERENNQALVMTTSGVRMLQFDMSGRHNIYEDSNIDNYLENKWYKSLSSTMKAAIQPTNIKQASYATWDDPDSRQETGYKGQVYNTISRHVFLPSVSEIEKVVDLKNPDKVKAFLHDVDIWTRDTTLSDPNFVEYLRGYKGSLGCSSTNYNMAVRSAFVIDLSKVDYKVTGHVDYK